MLSKLPAIAILAVYGYASPIIQDTASPSVTISNGVIIGTSTRVLNQPAETASINAYLGVPFASPPLAALRFAPPSPANPWQQPFVAQTLPPACLQQFMPGSTGAQEQALFNNPLLPPPEEDEDCLYLNIFAPKTASPTALKPVMFWLFGGNLQFGTASLAYYNGSSLANNEDVVVVVPNYRTNIFGFSNSPQIPFGQQNSGFLDQRFALQWVQNNIKAFGGDPSKVTLFGESAGGYSIKQLLANPPSPLPFRAAIMESQQTGLIGSGKASYNQVLTHFSCDTSTSPIDCLRNVNAHDLQAYVTSTSLVFPPVSNDGTYVGSNTLPSILSGSFADVPILIGTNNDEARVFLALAGLDNGTDAVQAVLASTGIDISGIYGSLLEKYDAEIVNDTYLLLSRIITDLIFTCTTSTFSSAIALAGRQPVWRYRYDAEFPNLSPFNDAGAYHTSEIPSAWGTYSLSNVLGDATPDQIALSKYMQQVWGGFATNPATGTGWPRLGSNFGVELGILGGTSNLSGETTAPLISADLPCALYNPLLLIAGRSY